MAMASSEPLPAGELEALRARVEALAVRGEHEEDAAWDFGIPGWVRSSGGGLKCVDTAEMEQQKGVLSHLLRTMGSNLLQGRSLVNISLPVRIFEPRSFLQRIPDSWCYAPVLLTRAALAADPLERFQNVVAFVVAGLSQSSRNLKPFNPILGETYQARFEDGAEVLMEQISHHPPVSAFQVMGPRGLYQLSGFHEFQASFRPNSVVGQQAGPNRVSFPDGTVVEYELPHVVIAGTLMGERNFQWLGTMSFSDKRNNLHLDLQFNPDAKSSISRFFSSQKSPCDTVRGDVYARRNERPNPKSGKGKPETVWDEEVVSRCEGSWMDGIAFDGAQVWARKTIRMFKHVPVPEEEALPSDSRFREDLKALLGGDQEAAQKNKQELEDAQRRDRTLRKNAAKVRERVAKLQRKGGAVPEPPRGRYGGATQSSSTAGSVSDSDAESDV